MKRLQPKKGFTLIELLIVIAIIAFLAVLAVPAVAGFMKNRRLDAAGGLVQGVLNKARTKAVKESERQVVLFYTSNATVDFVPPLTDITVPVPLAIPQMYGKMISLDQVGNSSGALWEVVDDKRLPENTAFTEKPPFALQFYPDGSCIIINSLNIDWTIAEFRDGLNATPADIEVTASNNPYSIHIDILQASGRSRSKIWEVPGL